MGWVLESRPTPRVEEQRAFLRQSGSGLQGEALMSQMFGNRCREVGKAIHFLLTVNAGCLPTTHMHTPHTAPN